MMARTGRSGVMRCALLTWMLSHVMMELEGILHDNCPDCGSTVAKVPFRLHCGAPLTCRCGFDTGHQCQVLKKGVHETCQASSCGWRDDHYDQLCEDYQHGLEPCQAACHSSSIRPTPGKVKNPSGKK